MSGGDQGTAMAVARPERSAGPMARNQVEQLLIHDVTCAIGEFRVPTPPDRSDGRLGRSSKRGLQP